MMKLYFIALIPHASLREEIKLLKEGMKTRFNAKHALKSPAHITLQIPFKRETEDESQLITALGHFAKAQSAFTVKLSGFDHFSNRVIFVKVENPVPIIDLHKLLNHVLIHQLDFQENEIKQEVHPHMTIAIRDLSKSAFEDAWPEFQKRSLQASFHAKSMFLLKHNGKYWDIFREFTSADEGES